MLYPIQVVTHHPILCKSINVISKMCPSDSNILEESSDDIRLLFIANKTCVCAFAPVKSIAFSATIISATESKGR